MGAVSHTRLMNAPTFPPLPKLPPLAGLATFAEAQKPGLSVGECVRRLKRYHYAFKRLHGIFLARLTAEPLHLRIAAELRATLIAGDWPLTLNPTV